MDVFVADLSCQPEVRRLADEVLRSLPRIDVLVNNVGGYWNTRHVTADGLERTFALNHLAPFLLTSLLLHRLKQSARPAWSLSNALHPGVVRTSFGAEDPGGVQRRFTPFMRPFVKSPAQGAATSVHLASAPGLEQVTGRYFAHSEPRRSSKRSYDAAAAARLWQVSADLAGLTPPAAGSSHCGSLQWSWWRAGGGSGLPLARQGLGLAPQPLTSRHAHGSM